MFQVHLSSTRTLTTTAHLAQTMTLLSLTVDELHEQIESELAANPALELLEERRCPTCHRALSARGACPVCSQPAADAADLPVVYVSPREDFYGSGASGVEDWAEDNLTPDHEDLPTYVLRQIASELDPQDRLLAAHLLTHLSEDGLLTVPLVEVALYFHQPLSRVERIQRIIQRAEPVGVGSSSPQQALLAQLEMLAETCSVPDLARRMIESQMDLLSRRQYAELARHFHVSQREVQEVVHFISENLNPYPGRSHWGEGKAVEIPQTQVYHRPDILINYLNDDPKNPLAVEIIMPLGGTLRVNPLFKQSLPSASQDKREEWRSDLERASLFVKCLQQRNHTMLRLMQRVVMLQQGYILHGEKHLRSVTRAQLAGELEVHESTISRAVANKAVQLPNKRIVPLASFFNRNLNVRTVLRDIIAEEKRPLSDNELVELLAKEGYLVARRTVAKYRAMEGILPAHLRHAVSYA